MNIDLSKYETITSHGYPSGVYGLGNTLLFGLKWKEHMIAIYIYI